MKSLPHLISLPEAHRLTGVSIPVLRKACHEGKLLRYQPSPGGTTYLEVKGVDVWLQGRINQRTSPSIKNCFPSTKMVKPDHSNNGGDEMAIRKKTRYQGVFKVKTKAGEWRMVLRLRGKDTWLDPGTTLKEAVNVRNDMIRESSGTRRQVSPIKFKGMVDKYAKWCHVQKKKSTARDEATTLEREFIKFAGWGEIELSLIDRARIDSWIVQRRGQVKGRTINKALSNLSKMLKKAREWNYLDTLPFDKVPKVGEGDSETRDALPWSDVVRVIEECKNFRGTRDDKGYFTGGNPRSEQTYLFVLIIAYTGARRGEALALEWEDVDLTERTITLRSRHTKDSEDRVIPFGDDLADELGRYHRGSGPVFKVKSFNRSVRSAFVRAGVYKEGRGVHTLRHSFGTLLGRRGRSIRVIQELLGHASVEVTKRYVHVDEDQLRAAVSDLSFKRPDQVVVKGKFGKDF